jgi:hypothetical protein
MPGGACFEWAYSEPYYQFLTNFESMKRFRLIFLLVVIVAACTEVDCPYHDKRLCERAYRDSIANLNPDTGALQLPDTGAIVNGYVQYNTGFFEAQQRNVFLEYFTGFRCSNCPPASATAANLKTQHSTRLSLVYVHATSVFAAPIATPPNPYSTDFRTPHGEQLISDFQISGLPRGTVSRKNFGTGLSIAPGAWSEAIDDLLNSSPQGFVQIRRLKVNEALTEIKVQVAYRLINDGSFPCRLSVGVVENGIIEAQKDGTQDIYPYTHNNVFRGNANGLYGDVVLMGSEDPGPARAFYTEYTIPVQPHWNLSNCRVVAYLHQEASLEVLQVAERPVAL